jgi:GTP pyrophosphokinase
MVPSGPGHAGPDGAPRTPPPSEPAPPRPGEVGTGALGPGSVWHGEADRGGGFADGWVRTPDLAEWLGPGAPADGREKPLDEYEPGPDKPSYSPKAIDINTVIDTFLDFYPDARDESVELIRGAYTFAAVAHSGATRLSGEPYLTHPLAVAHVLANMKLDAVSIAAGLLHDTVEDTKVTLDEIRENFGKEFGPRLALLVDGVTKIGKANFTDRTAMRAANLSKMVLASMEDLRVLLIKLADRLHNMRTLGYMEQRKREEIARETLDYYAPFASKLGIHKIKAELEDLSLFNIRPKDYTDITAQLAIGRSAREAYVERVKDLLARRLGEFGINAEVTGRNKHIYSIWRKMRLQNIPFEQIYDLYAFRVVVLDNSIDSCFRVLGIVHTIFTPLDWRMKDYISVPKPNGYRSLHTAVVGPDNIHIEIQIRTADMHAYSEDGVAAHWRYKDGGKVSKVEESLVQRFRETMSRAFGTDAARSPEEYLNSLQKSLGTDENIFVFTPKNDIIKLPSGATPIDFAYQIHSDVGNHLSAAFVNGSIVSLDHRLQNGSTVQIATSKFAHPTRDWLQKAASSRTRAKIRQALSELERAEHGDERREPPRPEPGQEAPSRPGPAPRRPRPRRRDGSDPVVLVKDMDGIVVHFRKCCRPIPGEPIVGFLTKSSGVAVHAADCPTVPGLPQERILSASWSLDGGEDMSADVYLRITHSGAQNAVPHIINAVSETKGTIIEFHADRSPDGKVLELRLALRDFDRYLAFLDSMKRLKGIVANIERLEPGEFRLSKGPQ